MQVATVILNYEFSKLSAAAVTLKRGRGHQKYEWVKLSVPCHHAKFDIFTTHVYRSDKVAR